MKFFHEYYAKEIELMQKNIERIKKAETAYNACYDLVDELNMLAGEEEVDFFANSPGFFLIRFIPKFTTVAEVCELVEEWAEWKGVKIEREKLRKRMGYYEIETVFSGVYIDIHIHLSGQCKQVVVGQKTVDIIEYVCE